MKAEIIEFLKSSMAEVKAEFALAGIMPRQFSHLGGDKQYATDELLVAMEDAGIPWGEWIEYEAIIAEPLFVKAVRWQAAYNQGA